MDEFFDWYGDSSGDYYGDYSGSNSGDYYDYYNYHHSGSGSGILAPLLPPCKNSTYFGSCDPTVWSTDNRTAELFECSPDYCVDLGFVCDGWLDCPGGEDEEDGGMDCSSHTCPYGHLAPEGGGLLGCRRSQDSSGWVEATSQDVCFPAWYRWAHFHTFSVKFMIHVNICVQI